MQFITHEHTYDHVEDFTSPEELDAFLSNETEFGKSQGWHRDTMQNLREARKAIQDEDWDALYESLRNLGTTIYIIDGTITHPAVEPTESLVAVEEADADA